MRQESSTIKRSTPETAKAMAPVRLFKPRVLQGCNIYHTSTVIRQRVDMGSLEGVSSSAAGSEFPGRFIERFTCLETMSPADNISEEFRRRLNEPGGVPLAEALFEATLAIEAAMAFQMRRLEPLEFATKISGDSPGRYDFVWQCTSLEVSRGAADAACRGLLELLPKSLQGPNSHAGYFTALAKLKLAARKRQRSITSEVLSQAAQRRGLPCENIGSAYLRLGHGIAQQVIHDSYRGAPRSPESDAQGASELIDREIIAARLPKADEWPVNSAEEACLAADTFGYPVILKPMKGAQISGMRQRVQLPADVPTAYNRALREGDSVVVEKMVAGQRHRLLVIADRFVAGLHIMPPIIVGDGIRTINELIDELNDDPLRNGIRQFKLELGPELVHALKYSGHDLLDVPAAGTEIKLDSVTNIIKGATHTDVTDIVHPDNQQLAVNAARAAGLSVAAVCFVTADITRSYREMGGHIISTGLRPELFMHVWPRHGRPRDVGGEVLKLLFPRGGNGRIPAVMVVGDRGTKRIARQLDTVLRASGKAVGLALAGDSRLCGEPLAEASSRPRDVARFLLQDPRAEMVISARSTRAVARFGLGIDRCDVTAIMDPAPDTDIDAYCTALETMLKATRGTFVVNAGNQVAIDRIRVINAQQVILVSPSQRNTAVKSHLDDGRVAVTGIRRHGRGYIVVQRKQKIIASIPKSSLVDSRGAPLNSRAVQERMFAIAMAYAVGLSSEEMETDLVAHSALGQTG